MKHVFSVLSVVSVAFFTLFLSTTNVSCKKGDTGPKVDTGVANAIYSPWLDVTLTSQGDTVFYKDIDAPKLTKDVLDKGEIKVYFNWGTPAQPDVTPLPYFDGGYLIQPSFSVGKISIFSNVPASTNASTKQYQYRYILIQGSVPARSAVNLNDYKTVKEYYNIPD